MLSKLLKYEIKATARIFLPLYVVLLVYAVIHKVISSIFTPRITAPEAISMFIYVMLLVAIFVVTFVVMIQRFYKNLLSDEGYLMFTLPTKPWKHIISKLLISMMWTVVSVIAAVASISIVAFDKIFTMDFIQVLQKAISDCYNYVGMSITLFIVEFLLAGIVSLVSSVLIIYASIAIGQLFNRHRILSSLGAFIALNTVSQILVSIVYAIPGFTLFRADISSVNDFHAMEPYIHLFIWLSIICFGFLSAGYFIVTNILSKRLNLE
jgi:hypothetical protein